MELDAAKDLGLGALTIRTVFMTPQVKRIVAGVIGLLVFTNLLTLAILFRDYRVTHPGRSKPSSGLKIEVERIPDTEATGEFNFSKIPSPSKTNAATYAQFSIVTGHPAGAGLDKLRAAYLPGGPDDPDENFFFPDGTYGGRFMIDFHQMTGIRQINTYSWHKGPRGPQVYKLYARDDSPNFDPVEGRDPVTLGWKFLADVDTRPASGDPGGQYGVSISSPKGLIGRYRYLLFDCRRTEDKDRWGNTFYSKVDVIAE